MRLMMCVGFAWLWMVTVAFGTPTVVGSGSQPRLLVAGPERVSVIFGRPGEILIADSVDGGVTFTEARLVAAVAALRLGMRRGPRVAVTDATMVISAIAGAEGDGPDAGLWAWASADAGKSWTRSRAPLNSVQGAVREGLHGMAANSDGLVACVWLDMRNVTKERPGTEVWMSVSKDGGLNWEPDRIVYSQPGGTVCECCHPSVAVDGSGKIHVMFRNVKDGARDMYFTSSNDGGASFSPSSRLGTGTWPLNACPMDGGEITAGPDGQVTSAWRRDKTAFLASPGAEEKELGPGRQPLVVSTPKGVWTGWLDGRTLLGKFGDGAIRRIADEAAFPSATARADGAVIVAWEQTKQVHVAIVEPQPTPR